MKIRLMIWLSSPCCGQDVRFITLGKTLLHPEAEITDGELACVACQNRYPIQKGIPRLTLAAGKNAKVAKTKQSFSWEWSRYPGSRPEDKGIFLEETQLPASEFKDKLVLDAGCGMGRYTLVALELGAEVVALDLSDSLLRLREFVPQYPRLHLVQGDLLKPPFKKNSFDIAYSQGVLHHTADTHAAFKNVAPLVRFGGYLSVWLYGKAGRYRDFSTNPIRADKAWVARHRRLAWFIVGLRHCVSDFLRFFTTRLPTPFAYALCYPLTVLGAIPGIKYLTFSVHPDFKVRLLENFDWLSPPFQYHHDKEELASWFKECGYEVLKILPHGLVPKPGILGRRTTHA